MKFSDYDPWGKPNSSGGKNSKGKNGKDSSKPDTSEPVGQKRPSEPNFQSPLTEAVRFIFGTINDMLGGKSSKRSPGPNKKKSGFLFGSGGLILVIATVVWVGLGVYMVDEQERGVVLRFGKYHSIITPGLKWQPYFIDKVIVLNVTQVRSFSSRGIMLTKDENIVDITLNVQYVIEDPRAFAINTKDPELSLSQATDSSLRHVVGSTVMDQVITEGRAALAVAVQERIQRYVSTYGTGISVSQISIQRADPPEQVKASFEDVISAREDKVRFNNQAVAYSNAIIPRARGEARRIKEEGEGYKRDKIARAEGQAERFNLVYAEYRKGPAITKQRLYIEAMEEVLKNSNKILIDDGDGGAGSNNILYLPLDRIIRQSTDTQDVDVLGDRGLINSGGSTDQLTSQSGGSVSEIVNKVLKELRRQSSRTK